MSDETPGGSSGGSNRLEGRRIADRYQIDNVVSAGASTIIAEAIDTELGRPVTVKIVRPELAVSSHFRTAFAERVAVAMSLSHPNVAAVLDSGEVDIDGETTVYWVVEYLGGGSLRDLFDRGRLLEPSQALVVGLEACRALDAGHQRGIVHTELTPSKLVFGTDGRLRVVDFAMASLMGADAWEEPATVATHVARYASPEQALSLDVDEKTDVYALSLCLIEGVTGKVPFAGDSTVSTLSARVGKLMPVTADMGSLAAVLERAGRPDPEDRWTAAEFGQALVQSAETLPRPEPIPVLATSLFATSVAAHAAAAAARAAAAGGASSDDAAGDDTVADDTLADDTLADDLADDALAAGGDAGDAVESEPEIGETTADTGAPAVPLVLMTDIADEPTDQATEADGDADVQGDGAATDTGEHSDGAGEPAVAGSSTEQMPAAMASAAALATSPPTTEIGATEPLDPTPSGTLYDEERSSRSWAKYLLIGLVVLVGVAALSYAAWLLLRTKSYEVPDLIGVDEAVALNEISGNGWDVQIDHERSDEVPDVDDVVRTIPAAGEQLDEGATFVLYVSDGPEFRTLPELDGTALAEARELLDDLRLVLVELDPEYSETVEEGSVIAWQVEDDASLTAGGQVLPETVIEVTVSLGPEPRPAPDLVNQTPADATAALDALQLVYAPAEDVFSSDIAAGLVAAQSPAPGTPVERGGSVSVQVSKGPEMVPIPDLAGMTYPQAQTALTDAGLVINSLLGTTEGTFVSISVAGNEVNAGDTFAKGTAVDLVFL